MGGVRSPRKFNKPGAMTQQAIADRMGISCRRVQQIEQRAMRKIREGIERRAKRAKVSVREWLFGE